MKKNIVLVVGDDIREQDLQYLPSLQAIRAKCCRFPYAITTFPLCAPSRTMLLTGRSQVTTELRANDAGEFDITWPTLGTRLKAAGYSTALIGKFLNKMANLTGTPAGWDTWDVLAKMNDLGREQTDILTNHAAAWLHDRYLQPTVPFFLYLAPVSPHGPLKGPSECDRGEERWNAMSFPPCPYPGNEHEWNRRMSSLCGLEHMLSKLLNRLSGALKNTYFIFVGDNGFIFENGKTGKSQLVWEALHVPMWVMGPGIVPDDRHEVVTLYDLSATVMALAETAVEENGMDGQSMIPLLQGSSADWTGSLPIEGGDPNADDSE